MADQEGGGTTLLSQILNISLKQDLLSFALSDLIVFNFPSSILSKTPISSHLSATLV